MAGRKNFVSGSILTASDVNSFLMDQSVMVFDDSAARGSAIPTPIEGMVTYLKDTNLVEAFTGSVFTPVSVVKSVNIVNKTAAQSFSATNTGFTDITDLSITVTPKSAASKFFVYSTLYISNSNNGVRTFNSARILRDATNITPSNTDLSFTTSDNAIVLVPLSAGVVDAPLSTSALTYKVQATQNVTTGSISVFIDRSAGSSTRIASSFLVVVEFE